MMARIKGKGTKPELLVRQMAHRFGYRFRLYQRNLPGSPDLVFPRLKLVIFVNGCFWHRHENCKYAYNPKTNVEFWTCKFKNNVLRDKKVKKELEGMGWRVANVWECETANAVVLRRMLSSILRS